VRVRVALVERAEVWGPSGGFLWLLRVGGFDLGPAGIGIVGGHLLGDFRGVFAQVALVEGAVLVDDERHDAGAAVVGGEGNDCKAADELIVDHVIAGAAGGSGSLGGDQAIEVAEVGASADCRLGIFAVAFGFRDSDQIAQRAWGLAFGGAPEEAIFFAGVAENFERVGRDTIMIGVGHGIFALGIHDGEADLDGVQLVTADTAVDDFLLAGGSVKAPLSLAVFIDNGDGKRPVGGADDDSDFTILGGDEGVFFVVSLEELVDVVTVGNGVAGGEKAGFGGAEDGLEGLLVAGAEGADEGAGGIIGRGEGALRGATGDEQKQCEEQEEGQPVVVQFGHDKILGVKGIVRT